MLHNKVEGHKDYQRGIKLADKEFWTGQDQRFRVFAGQTRRRTKGSIWYYRDSRTSKNEFLIMGYQDRCHRLGISHSFHESLIK